MVITYLYLVVRTSLEFQNQCTVKLNENKVIRLYYSLPPVLRDDKLLTSHTTRADNSGTVRSFAGNVIARQFSAMSCVCLNRLKLTWFTVSEMGFTF